MDRYKYSEYKFKPVDKIQELPTTKWKVAQPEITGNDDDLT
jgi:hypothetical protein